MQVLWLIFMGPFALFIYFVLAISTGASLEVALQVLWRIITTYFF